MAKFSTSSSRSAVLAAATCFLIGGAVLSPARAWQGQISFTTFLRAGPGPQYVVLDEVWGGDFLQVDSCADGWCRTTTGGKVAYIAEGMVAKTDNPLKPPAPSTKAGCFEGNRAGYGKGETEVYCPAASTP